MENLHLYISTVAGRYAGRMYSWDVVNEAIWGVGHLEWANSPDWRSHMRQAGRGLDAGFQSQWYNAFANGATGDECGSDYIYYAFRLARIYDPFAILYYNDYNDHVPGKRDAIAQMVMEINERWQQDPLYDGRLLIEGIGMQAHYSISGWMTEPHLVREAIELYIATGARLSITELDLRIGGTAANPATPTPELLQRQAERYAYLFGLYLEFSDYIERVTFWGISDNYSWLSYSYPLIFDDRFQPKPAFFAILEILEAADAPNISIPKIRATNLPNGRLGESYGFHLQADQNNFAPLLWTVTNGELPSGLRLIPTTGAIIGTPEETGTFTFTITTQNAKGSDSQSTSLTIN
jgi:endo-1,4-beta-xylanase